MGCPLIPLNAPHRLIGQRLPACARSRAPVTLLDQASDSRLQRHGLPPDLRPGLSASICLDITQRITTTNETSIKSSVIFLFCIFSPCINHRFFLCLLAAVDPLSPFDRPCILASRRRYTELPDLNLFASTVYVTLTRRLLPTRLTVAAGLAAAELPPERAAAPFAIAGKTT